jgi:hypothetical protein
MDVFKSLVRKFLGEGAVKMLESAMNKLGIDQDQGAKMLAMFVDYAKLKAGTSLAGSHAQQREGGVTQFILLIYSRMDI